jgi:glutamine amidotransferase
MRPYVGIVDYGRGNLRSVAKALEFVGARVKVSGSPRELSGAAGLVLPGVGAFGDAMAALRRLGLAGFLKKAAKGGRPLFGVCVGQQLFYEKGTEFGSHEGLGFFKGSVSRFPKGLKVPHMGWNQVRFSKGFPLAQGLGRDPEFYFVHSYRGRTPRRADAAGVTRYGKDLFDSALWRDNLFATQFHPEKSQKAGLKLYENFWKLAQKD